MAVDQLVLGMMAAGIGGIFLWLDRRQAPSRALGGSLVIMGLELFLGGFGLFAGTHVSPLAHVAVLTMTALTILGGVEWGRRIGAGGGRDAAGKRGANGVARAASVLFRVAQGFVLLYWSLGVGYALLWPRRASAEGVAMVGQSGAVVAVSAAVLGCTLLLAAIAILLLRFLGRIDPAEIVRLRALMLAAPFLLTGIEIKGTPMVLLMTVGLLIYLAGSVRYLVIQQERGDFVGRFVSPQLAQLARDTRETPRLQRERRRLTVLACDLRGFTAFAREADSEVVVDLLERYYAIVGAVVAVHGGTVKDHAGDGVLVLVGAPLAVSAGEERAATMALDMVAQVSAMLRQSGTNLGVGIGLATGEVIVGALHGAARLEYAAVGNAVNLAARLCGRARDAEVLLDDATAGALPERFRVAAEAAEPLKGFAEPVPVFSLQGAAAPPPGRRPRRPPGPAGAPPPADSPAPARRRR